MKKMLLIVGLALTLSACAVHTRDGSVIVDPEGRFGEVYDPPHPHSRGRFCPPGQAKKGNC